MKKITDAMRRWGPLGVSVFTAAVVAALAFAYFVARPPIEDVVTPSGPAIPVELIDHANEGVRAGLERGYQFGAEPAVAMPRPTHFAGYQFHASPNFSGRGACEPEAIVLHVTGPGSMAGMASWFKNPASQVSAHFGIGKNGELHQYVPLEAAAWHAGILNRPDTSNPTIAGWLASGLNPNRCTVGIELLLGGPAEPLVEYPAMASTLDSLLLWLRDTTGIPLDATHVIGHYQIDAVNRATDPRCCLSIADVLAAIAGPAADAYCCEQPYGGRWNLTRERWEWQPDTLWTWREDDPVWRCESGCP